MQKEQKDGMTVYRLPVLFTLSNTPIHPRWYFTIRKIASDEKPDVINAHAPVPFMPDIASFAAGSTPFVLTYHTGPMMRKGEWFADACIAMYEKYFLPLLAGKAKIIICASDYAKTTVFARHAAKTVTITPGVDAYIFRPAKYICKNRLLFVGSLHKAEKYKGLETLLLSIIRLKKKRPDIVLTVIGTGDYRDEYKRLCSELKIEKHVIFAGRREGKALVAAYQQTAVFVHPSRFDSFPLVLLEAMACKIPVVSTRVGGIPEIVTHGKGGLLVKPENPETLARAIEKMLSDPILAQHMRVAGRQNVLKQCNWELKVEETNTVLRSIV